MNHHLSRAAFGAGLIAVAWVGAGHLRANPLALLMTLAIAGFYLLGALELRRFDQATAGLARALQGLTAEPATLDDWLAQLPAGLRTAVRLRVDGERVALPGPALTPYLVGLLVLLGMLGTFTGMVLTLAGTGAALQQATDLQHMRDALSAPVQGLGLAFGASVAGVAASAMLGLMSTLARRERQQVVQQLDTATATTLRRFTRAHQRDEALQLQQAQARLLPVLVDRLEALATQLQAQAADTGAQLLAGQQRFQAQAEAAYRGLAASVDQTLQRSLADSTRLAAAALQPLAETTMAGITRETTALHGRVAGTLQQQLEALSDRLAASAQALAERQAQQHAAQDSARLAAWSAALEQTAQRIGSSAEEQAGRTIAALSQLAATAADAPRAAAAVVAQLRETLADNLARDSAMREDHAQVVARLQALLDGVQQGMGAQQAAIDTLVAGAAAALEQAGGRFGAQVDAGSARLADLAAQLGGSAVDVASLGDAFGAAVDLFGQASDRLAGHLQRVDETLLKQIARSDEQLAYYVAQAREVIDLSLLSQKQVVEDLQRLRADATA